jgi:hypothetical protein
MGLTSKQRAVLYDAEAAKALAANRGALPICNICDGPVDGTRERWHESHNPLLPRALGGAVTGIAHERCNLEHNWRIDTPLIAKNNRLRQRNIGAYRTKHPMRGGRSDTIKIKLDGTVVDRATGEVINRRPYRG